MLFLLACTAFAGTDETVQVTQIRDQEGCEALDHALENSDIGYEWDQDVGRCTRHCRDPSELELSIAPNRSACDASSLFNHVQSVAVVEEAVSSLSHQSEGLLRIIDEATKLRREDRANITRSDWRALKRSRRRIAPIAKDLEQAIAFMQGKDYDRRTADVGLMMFIAEHYANDLKGAQEDLRNVIDRVNTRLVALNGAHK